ncbi:MAG: restriction endonuclease subunit S, partial [Idiomarina sp.]
MVTEWSKIENVSQLSPDWKVVALQSFSSPKKNSFVNGPFGSDLLSSELVDEGMPVIYIRDIKGGRYQRKSTVCVTSEKYNFLPACQVEFGDVLVSKVGDPPCEAAFYDVSEPGIVTQDVIRIRPAN